jgi:hypothetical protein
MKIKHVIFSFAVTFLLSTGLWAQSYSAPRVNGGTLVNAAFRNDRYRNDRYRQERYREQRRREHRRHERHERHHQHHDRHHHGR